MKVVPGEMNQYLDDVPFTFIRFGNGEWDCIFKQATRTGSGSQTLLPVKLRQGMEDAVNFTGPRYFKALQVSYLEYRGYFPKIEDYLPKQVWHNADVFYKASVRGKLYPLVEWLRSKQVTLIGPSYLSKLKRYIPLTHIEVAAKDCFYDYREIRTEILTRPLSEVYILSAGPTAKLLSNLIYRVAGHRAHVLDLGSLWDPYCGKKTRRYHSKITSTLIKRNMEGA